MNNENMKIEININIEFLKNLKKINKKIKIENNNQN